MVKKLFILGADDPEMQEIESIISFLGYNFDYASSNKERCNPSNAYNSEFFNIFFDDIIFIECDYKNKIEDINHIFIDHHNIGDFGYHLNYEDFLEASSIGQFIKYIFENDFDYVISNLNYEFKENNLNLPNGYFFEDNIWKLSISGYIINIPNEISFIAAIDHCPICAYKGKCNGIDASDLLDVRLESIATNLDVNKSLIYNVYIKYQTIISEFISKCNFKKIIDLTHLDLGKGIYPIDYLVLRELAIFSGIPIAVKLFVEDIQKYKLMFLSLNFEQVEEIITNKEFNSRALCDVFGVPARGYAGGFICE